MTDPAFILVEPQMGENIGSAARAMWNFRHRRMRVVNPRDGWPNTRAVALASGAGGVLDEAGVYPTTAEAVADLNYVYATTARPREMTKLVMTPEAAARDAHVKAAVAREAGAAPFKFTPDLAVAHIQRVAPFAILGDANNGE